MNLWKCPLCGKLVDYGDTQPSDGRTLCEKFDERVRMQKASREDEARFMEAKLREERHR